VIYRSDGGRFARALVCDSRQLQAIHDGLRRDNWGGSVDDRRDAVVRQLEFIEDEIRRSINEMYQQLMRGSLAASQGGIREVFSASGWKPAGASSGTPSVDAFLQHIKSLMNDDDTFYSVYLKDP
jgi:hypothetical protein